MDKAAGVIRRLGDMVSARAVLDSQCAEIAARVRPWLQGFQRQILPGQKQTAEIFDSTAILALDRYQAAMESMLTPRTQRWHGLKPIDHALSEDAEVRAYTDEVTRILFAVRYSPRANFASQANEVYGSVGAFSAGVLFIDDAIGRGIRYRNIPFYEVYFEEDHQGLVDTVYRKFKLSARQAVQRFGKEVPEDITKAIEKNPEQPFDFIHAVMPRADIDVHRNGYKGWPIASCYVSVAGKKVVSEGGYATMPYAIARLEAPPAMVILPEIKMLNEMSKTVIRAATLAVDPPLLMQEDGALQAFSMRPGSHNFGGVDDRGQVLVHALKSEARVDIGLEMMDQRRRVINDAFLVTLFQILVEQPQMTATEAMLRAQEKGALLAPTMGRQQSEFLGPLVEREIDILARAGVLPPMPDALRRAGGDVSIEYTSPLNLAQRSADGVAILRTLEAVAPLAQADPAVLMVFDIPAMARELAEINGVPSKVLRSKGDVAKMKSQADQAAQMQQLLAAAPVAASAAKDMASAGQMMGSAPTPPGLGG